MTDETITIKGWVSTDKVGSQVDFEVSFDRDEWNDMNLAERDEAMKEHMFDCIEWGYEGE